jgi:hypothetical protein
VQQEVQSRLGLLFIEKYLVETMGGQLVGEQGEKFDTMVEVELPPEQADEVKQDARVYVRDSAEPTYLPTNIRADSANKPA